MTNYILGRFRRYNKAIYKCAECGQFTNPTESEQHEYECQYFGKASFTGYGLEEIFQKKTKPDADWVQSLDHCVQYKMYYFKVKSDILTIVFISKELEVVLPGSSKCYSCEELQSSFTGWRISLEPVPMPEVER